MSSLSQAELSQQSDELYARYVKPLEPEHRGEYAAVARDGRVLLGIDLLDLAERAVAEFGPGSYLFHVGNKVIGRWR